MAYRKERALLLMAANGAGLAIVGPKILEARIAENWDLMNLHAVIAIIFVPGILAGYFALACAEGKVTVSKREVDAFRAWELLAIFPLLTIAFYIQVATDYRAPSDAERAAPVAPTLAPEPERPVDPSQEPH